MANTYTTAGSDPNIGGVYPQEWEAKLQERLNKPTNWKEVCKVMFSTSWMINSPYMSTEPTIQTGTRGTAYGFSDFTVINDQLNINQYRPIPAFIDRADLAQMTLVSQMEIADRQGKAIDEHLESVVLAAHAGWTNFDNSSIGGAAGNIDVSVNNIDNIIRGIKREIVENDAQDLANEKGMFIVWRAADMEMLEEFAQANGFVLADTALKNGIKSGYHFMGMDHYVSNSHTAGHLFGGVKKIMQVGILSTTYGKIVQTVDPNLQSGVGVISRVDYGVNTPTGLVTSVFDILVD